MSTHTGQVSGHATAGKGGPVVPRGTVSRCSRWPHLGRPRPASRPPTAPARQPGRRPGAPEGGQADEVVPDQVGPPFGQLPDSLDQVHVVIDSGKISACTGRSPMKGPA